MLRFPFQLDHFRHLFQRQWAEYALEVVFLSVGGLFLLGSGLDFLLWRWKFLEVPFLRWLIFGGTLTILIWESEILCRKFRKIPKTRFETFHFLRAMQNRSVPASVPAPPPLPKQLENALDFLERPQPEAGKELREAVIAQTDREMETFRPSDWLRLERFWRVRWLLRSLTALFLFAFCVLAAQCGENASVAVERFAMPWKSETAWKIDFRPQWKPFPKEILEGETFDAEITLQKDAPFVLVAVWDSADALEPRQILRVEPIFGRFLVRIPNVQKSFWISTFLPGENPQTNELLPVSVQTFPRLTNAILRLQAPDATHQKAAETGWEISGLTGSRVGVMIAADRPLKDAKIRFSNGTYVPGEPVQSGKDRVFKFRFELLQDCDYWLELTDQAGLTAALERHPIRTRTDLKPIVVCESPENARPFLPGAKLKLRFQAQDDFGLTTVGFRWVVEKPDTQAEGGFSFPKTQDGTPKWTVFSVWNAADPETGEVPDVPLPLSQTAEFTWDSAFVPLEAGMRLRVEAFAVDSDEQRTFGETFYLNVVTPDTMRLRAFHQWLAITQELRRMGKLLTEGRKRLDGGLFQENARETSQYFTQSMGTIQHLLDVHSADGISVQVTQLEEELTGNPEFPFHGSATSSKQIRVLQTLREALGRLETEFFPELNREIVFLSKSLQFASGTNPAQLEDFHNRLVLKFDQILEFLRPMLKTWNREECEDGMVRDFEVLMERHAKLAEILQSIWEQVPNRAPMEIRMEYATAFQTTEEELWAIYSGLECFLVQYDEILDLNLKSKEVIPIQEGLDAELHALLENRLWDFQRLNVQLDTAFKSAFHSIQPPSSNPLRDSMMIFSRMLTSEERILHLLEKTNAPENVVKQNEVEVVPLARMQRKAFHDCAVIQRFACTHFAKQGKKRQETVLPRVLAPLWEALAANFQVSIEDFQTLSVHQAPPLELLQDQYTLQLQIYDQLAEFTQIAEGLKPEMGTLVKISDFGNRLSNPKKEESPTDEEKTEESLQEESSEEDSSHEEPEIFPADVLVLISMQTLILEQTKELVANQEKNAEEKAAQIAFLTEQERKTADCAKTLGFDATPNSTFDGILAQMFQVMFLLEKQDLGEMTISIQEEILYGLRSALQHQEVADDGQSKEQNGKETENSPEETLHEQENLSENSDSRAQEMIPGEKTGQKEGNKFTIPTELERLQNDFWGELPSRQRDFLRLMPEEKPIPGYEKVLEMYYRELKK